MLDTEMLPPPTIFPASISPLWVILNIFEAEPGASWQTAVYQCCPNTSCSKFANPYQAYDLHGLANLCRTRYKDNLLWVLDTQHVVRIIDYGISLVVEAQFEALHRTACGVSLVLEGHFEVWPPANH